MSKPVLERTVIGMSFSSSFEVTFPEDFRIGEIKFSCGDPEYDPKHCPVVPYKVRTVGSAVVSNLLLSKMYSEYNV